MSSAADYVKHFGVGWQSRHDKCCTLRPELGTLDDEHTDWLRSSKVPLTRTELTTRPTNPSFRRVGCQYRSSRFLRTTAAKRVQSRK